MISVASNLYPKAVAQLTAHALKGDYTICALHRKLYPIFKNIFIESNPSPIIRHGLQQDHRFR